MLFIKNIGTLATPLGTSSRCGSDQGKIEVLHNAAVLIDGEKIAAVTANGELPEYSALARYRRCSRCACNTRTC